MEISQYDEYIPEKELDRNFKIPRKRTAEDSFGVEAGNAYAEYYAKASQAVQAAQLATQFSGQYTSVQPPTQPNSSQEAATYTQYATLSGAASQASAYTNSKPPVQYSVPASPKLNSAIQPPLPPSDFGAVTPAIGNSYNTSVDKPPANTAAAAYSTIKATGAQTINTYNSNPENQKSANSTSWGGVSNQSWNSGNATGGNRNWAATKPGTGNIGGVNRNWVGNKLNTFNEDSKDLNSDRGNRNLNRNWTGNNLSSFSKDSSANMGGPNRSWGGAPNRNWSGNKDSTDFPGGSFGGGSRNWGKNNINEDLNDGNFGANRNWGSNDSPDHSSWNVGGGSRNWGKNNLLNDGNMRSNRNWGRNDADAFNEDSDFPVGNVGRGNRNWGSDNSLEGNRNWGGMPNRKWGGSLDGFNKDENDFNMGGIRGGKRWNMGREGGGYFGEDKGEFNNDGTNLFSGGSNRGRGQFGGRGSWNDRFGNNGASSGYGGEEKLFGNQQGSWNQRGYRNEEYENEQKFGFNASGGFGARGGMFQDSRGRGRGNFRGGPGRSFGGNRGNDKMNEQAEKMREKPKNLKNRQGVPITIADATDETLPKELRMMFQPLYCKLCTLQMSSNVMAKMHYHSKNHEKKIRKYLLEHSEKTGEPLHPRATTTAAQGKKEKEEDTNPKYFHCDVCDLPLTGKLHAESHYMGKNHNAVVMGRKQPSGKGHYDENGKWIREQAPKPLPEGEDTFGMDFKKAKSASAPGETAADGDDKTETGQFSCSICMVTCTCQEQINMHFSGAKHKKRLRQMGVALENFEVPKATDDEAGSKTPTAEDETSTFQMDSKDDTPQSERNDYSRYKTPSGYYYCEKCNLTVNSEVQLKQHLTSKNHMKKQVKKSEV